MTRVASTIGEAVPKTPSTKLLDRAETATRLATRLTIVKWGVNCKE